MPPIASNYLHGNDLFKLTDHVNYIDKYIFFCYFDLYEYSELPATVFHKILKTLVIV